MPEFLPGEVKTAIASMANPTAKAFDYSVELYMGTNLALMSQASFRLEAGEQKDISLPVTMPSVFGNYPINIGVFSNGEFIPPVRAGEDVIIIGPPEFIYVSDIRVSHTEDYRHDFIFEVDIQNIGGQADLCSITAHNSSAYGGGWVSYNNQTQIIQPGQTVTFSGLIENQAYGAEGDPAFWQRLDYIVSDAGPISFAFGRSLSLISFDYPSQISSGSEYWATQVVHLPAPGKRMFLVSLIIRGFEPAYYRVDYSSYVQAGRSFIDVGIVIDQEGDYEIRGVYQAEYGGGPIIQRPAKAEYYWQGWHPIPPGIYTMYSKVKSYEVSDWGEWGSQIDVWDYPIGVVEIV